MDIIYLYSSSHTYSRSLLKRFNEHTSFSNIVKVDVVSHAVKVALEASSTIVVRELPALVLKTKEHTVVYIGSQIDAWLTNTIGLIAGQAVEDEPMPTRPPGLKSKSTKIPLSSLPAIDPEDNIVPDKPTRLSTSDIVAQMQQERDAADNTTRKT